MSTPHVVAHSRAEAAPRCLHRGFDPAWGWWVSADRVRFVYSSISPAQAEENFFAINPERMSQ